MKKSFILPLFNLLLLAGCADREAGLDPGFLRTDTESVVVQGEFAESSDSIFVVNITSNRSWFAHLNYVDFPVGPEEQVNYAHLRQREEMNFSSSTRTTPLEICFLPNLVNSTRYGVLELYSEGSLRKSIPIAQKGITYRLNATASKTSIGENGGTATIAVDCNTSWTARIGLESEFDISIDKKDGYGRDTLEVEFPETEQMEPRTAYVVLSAEGCSDVKLTFVQEGSKLIPFGQIKTSFISTGTGTGVVPALVVDESSVKPEAVSAGAKYYYTIGASSFEALADPSESDKEIPAGGILFLPEGYQTVATATQKYNVFYIKIAGIAEGCRKSYTKVLLRNWSFGQKYIYSSSSNGLTLSGAAGGKSTYYMRFAESGVSTMTVSAVSTMAGDGRILMKYHSAAQTSTVNFKVDDEVVHSIESKGVPATDPQIVFTPVLALAEGSVLSISNMGPQYSFLWNCLIMEECQYKP